MVIMILIMALTVMVMPIVTMTMVFISKAVAGSLRLPMASQTLVELLLELLALCTEPNTKRVAGTLDAFELGPPFNNPQDHASLEFYADR